VDEQEVGHDVEAADSEHSECIAEEGEPGERPSTVCVRSDAVEQLLVVLNGNDKLEFKGGKR
jgi:hypothetical protein